MTQPAPSAPQPEQLLMQMATGKWVSKTLSVVADLGIPDLLSGGPRSVDDLATRSAVDTDSLYRLLRASSGVGVLTELPDRRFENNTLSTLMRSDVPGSLRAMVRWMNEDSVFEHFQTHPEAGKIFNEAMISFTTVTGGAVAKAYDFWSSRFSPHRGSRRRSTRPRVASSKRCRPAPTLTS